MGKNKIKLTKKALFAIEIAFAELENSGDWENYLSDEDIEKVYEGWNDVMEEINKLKQNKDE